MNGSLACFRHYTTNRCKMEAEIRSPLQESQQEEIIDLKKELRKRDAS